MLSPVGSDVHRPPVLANPLYASFTAPNMVAGGVFSPAVCCFGWI